MRYLSSILIGALAVACGGSVESGGSGGQGGSGGSTGGAPGGGSGGVTGGTGGVTGGTGGVTGGTGGSGGTPSDICQKLATTYGAVLAQAKYCNALLSILQCTMQVPDELDCPCPTYVNPANQDALSQLQDLHNEWQANNCVHPCPAIACPVPQGAGCIPNGGGGDADACQDFWPD